MKKKLIIAIDGPAGSGKSTTAKLLAQKLRYLYIDTGAMYRAITYLAMENNIVEDAVAVTKLLKSVDIRLKFEGGITHTFIDEKEVTDYIRTPEVNEKVSYISKMDDVRLELVKRQRIMGQKGGVVMEGRDIGTFVYPNADLKVFLVASLDARSVRREIEFQEKGKIVPIDKIRENLAERDRLDSTRTVGPLTKAPDAIEIDTSNTSIEEQVEIIRRKAVELMELLPPKE